MSYILDALRRADAERERKRGSVPSLQSQQHTLVPDEEEAPRRPAWLLGGVAALVLLVVAVGAWLLLGDRAAAPARVLDAAATAPTVTTPAEPRPMTLSEMAAAPAPTRPAALPPMSPVITGDVTPQSTIATSTTRLATAVAPSRAATARTLPADGIEPARSPRRQAMATSPSAVPATSPRADASADARIVPQAELPDGVRREIPALAFNGASYSGDAASRMVIINGQVFHEGDTIAKGLVLQQIRLRTAVLAFRGYRYEVTY